MDVCWGGRLFSAFEIPRVNEFDCESLNLPIVACDSSALTVTPDQ
jgi:hypothetical protein